MTSARLHAVRLSPDITISSEAKLGLDLDDEMLAEKFHLSWRVIAGS
jgi:hypothetical protein